MKCPGPPMRWLYCHGYQASLAKASQKSLALVSLKMVRTVHGERLVRITMVVLLSILPGCPDILVYIYIKIYKIMIYRPLRAI